MSRVISALLGLAMAIPAGLAQADRALVIGASEAERRGLWGTGSEVDSAQALRDAGFEVVTADAGSVAEMRTALSRFLDGLATQERIVIHLSGTFFNDGQRHWLVEADRVARPDIATIDSIALSVETVLFIAQDVPGGAVVALGTERGKTEAGAGLTVGLANPTAPQGVTLVQGPAKTVAEFVSGPLLEQGRTLPEAIAKARSLLGTGFLSPHLPFLPEDEDRPVAPPNAAEVERAIWQATLAQESIEGFEGYLQRYPEGFFVTEARQAIERIRTEPNRLARLAEEELELSRADQRKIQQELTLLDFNPRGVDGIFGAGSRAAIVRFQQQAGFPTTSYLDSTQIERLALQAERRRAEIAAEDRRQALETEKKDREAWAVASEAGDMAALRTYLDAYPKGLFAPIAKERLDTQEKAEAERIAAQEQSDWEAAAASGTVDSLQAYLAAHPEGAHAEAAGERLDALARDSSDTLQEARAGEAALDLNPVTRLLLERRLDQMELEPGFVDGTFDDDTRAALRRFQRENELEPTGYVDQAVIERMLSDLGGLLAPGR
ncbi:peptidoglycan-binding protein [Tropicimonas sp. TH_r6]|uniref:peptidoglycan-binding protein n=1 Tax=Tropicimonas sp. TH_r6 TaxID=3082085 RepID=UPI002955B1FA|nr:peptidoglycan-binding protein [Tropicimonas sp. TH_r6]MDV7143356.1 peptidoglycan-binding protein [Tropicimonas sp. TH_r6]